jgi:hypothetical protein
MAKVRELASSDPAGGRKVDVSMFPWLGVMDKVSANHIPLGQGHALRRQPTALFGSRSNASSSREDTPPTSSSDTSQASVSLLKGKGETKARPVKTSVPAVASTTKRKASVLDSDDTILDRDDTVSDSDDAVFDGDDAVLVVDHADTYRAPIAPMTSPMTFVETLTSHMGVEDLNRALAIVQDRLRSAQQTESADQTASSTPALDADSTGPQIPGSVTEPILPGSGTDSNPPGLSTASEISVSGSGTGWLLDQRMEAAFGPKGYELGRSDSHHDRPAKRAKHNDTQELNY